MIKTNHRILFLQQHSYGNNSEEHDKEKYKIIDFVKEYKANHKEKSWF
jgi:hypothetical protein